MPQNAFLEHQNYESKQKRNSYDLSKRNFLTGKLGALLPVYCTEVASGDSVQIDASFLLNFFPFVFPVQTPIRASLYFFYGRNRIVWDSWQDFAYNNKQPDHPFILQPNGTFWKTGELADYLGVPTTYSSLGSRLDSGILSVLGVLPGERPRRYFSFGGLDYDLFSASTWAPVFSGDFSSKNLYDNNSVLFFLNFEYEFNADNYRDDPLFINPGLSSFSGCHYLVYADRHNDEPEYVLMSSTVSYPPQSLDKFSFDNTWIVDSQSTRANGFDLIALTLANYPNTTFRVVLCMDRDVVESLYPEAFDDYPYIFTETSYNRGLSYVYGEAETVDLSSLGSNPFSGTRNNPPRIPLNAIPFRLYEAIYNAYFRNERNDPFIVNGEPEYNKYNTTRADGADETPYKIYYRNWEADFLTSATQTPQQGLAPLVGINVRGDMEFLNDDGTISKIRPTIANDGHTITGITGVVENGSPEAVRSAMELITSGISINDFRQVNSLQRWLEDNLRRGLKYRDQVMASTGVKIRYDELDMPEFIGGFSRPVQITSITQATPSTADDNALGDRAGQASVLGGSNHKITHYCDEAGYIMGILCVYPQPVYTQLLPKYFLKSDALSYYHPQFGSIGLQPISYREVCPIQVLQEGGDLDATFGYQRPWYDLIAAVDEAHGNMRTNMRDYLMHRTFAGIPRLGADFLHIDPKQLNDVFAITDDTEDVFQGQIFFNVYMKRAIPRFGIPRIQ